MSETSRRPASQTGEIFWRNDIEIVPGRLGDFLSAARDLVTQMADERGTRGYDYYLSEDSKTCQIFEYFENTAGLIAHARTFGRQFADRFLKATRPIGFSVYGAYDDTVKAILAPYGAIYFVKVDQRS